MKKNKYPVLVEKIIKPERMYFNFECGDLWKRENVDKWDDIDQCLKLIEPLLKKHKTKLQDFVWDMNYSAPYMAQIDYMKKNKLKEYPIEDQNKHFMNPVWYHETNLNNELENTLYVGEDLIVANYEFVVDLVNKIEGLETLSFWMMPLSGGFLENDPGGDVEDIQDTLNNKSWFNGILTIDEVYAPEESKYEEDLHGNDLDGLKFIRENIDPKIKFEFSHLEKHEEKILKDNRII